MIRKIISIAIIVGLISCEPASNVPKERLAEPLAGSKAPAFELSTLSGETRSLTSYRNNIVVLNFWALWCAPCVAELPSLSKLQEKLSEKGVRVVAINIDPPSKKQEVEKLINENNYRFEALLDPEMSSVNNYGVTGFPETVFIDREGNFFALRDPDSGELSTKFIREREWDSETYLSLFSSYLIDNK